MKIWKFEKINLGQGGANFIARPRAQSCLATPLYTFVTSAASDPCLTLKLLLPSPPPSSILNLITATPSLSISTPPKYSVCSLSKTHSHWLLPECLGIIISLLSLNHFTG